jgi:hypothetical protein
MLVLAALFSAANGIDKYAQDLLIIEGLLCDSKLE